MSLEKHFGRASYKRDKLTRTIIFPSPMASSPTGGPGSLLLHASIPPARPRRLSHSPTLRLPRQALNPLDAPFPEEHVHICFPFSHSQGAGLGISVTARMCRALSEVRDHHPPPKRATWLFPSLRAFTEHHFFISSTQERWS